MNEVPEVVLILMAEAMVEPSLQDKTRPEGNAVRLEVLKRALAKGASVGWALGRVD